MASNQEPSGTHPAALGPAGRMWEMAKHVLSKAAKYASRGMMLGGLIGIPGALLGGTLGSIGTTLAGGAGALLSGVGLTTVGGWLGGFASSAAVGTIASIAVPLLIPAIAVGAALAVVGMVAGFAGANEKANEVDEDRMANYDRALVNQQRMQAMQMRQAQTQMAMVQQGQAAGMAPNLGLPGGRGGRDLTA